MILSFFSILMGTIFYLDFYYIFWLFPFFLFLVSFYYGDSFDGLFFCDYYSVFLIFVTVTVVLFSILSMSMDIYSIILFWLMLCMLNISFLTSNYLVFYFSFELVFVLMFVYLLGWGKTAERLQASFYMFFYTVVFSLPFLILLVDSSYIFSSIFYFLNFFFYSDFFWVFIFIVFIVKLPLFGFHLWLPKAHVEAPVSGSMILAGVLLKLGGYGIIRFITVLCDTSFSLSLFLSYFFYVSLYGGLLISLVCIRQMDLKLIIAYSSVVHMSVMALGLFSFSSWGVFGATLMMVAHGLVSPLMFYLMTYFYNFKHSRSILLLKGVILVSPVFCFLWFICCSLNLGLPPFMSFFSEVIIVSSLISFSLMEWVLVVSCCFFTGLYCIFMYTHMGHGSSVFNPFYFLNSKVILLSFSHCFFVLSYPLFFFYF